MMPVILKRRTKQEKRKKESFRLGCEILQEYIKFDEEGEPVFFKKQQLLNKAHEAQNRLVEIDAIRREHQQATDVYHDLY